MAYNHVTTKWKKYMIIFINGKKGAKIFIFVQK